MITWHLAPAYYNDLKNMLVHFKESACGKRINHSWNFFSLYLKYRVPRTFGVGCIIFESIFRRLNCVKRHISYLQTVFPNLPFHKTFLPFYTTGQKNNIFHCKFSILLCFFYLTYTNDKPCPSFSCKSFVPVNKLRKYVNTYPRGLDEVINNFLCHLGKITHINGSTNEITFSYEFVNIFISPGSKSSRRHIYFVIFDTFYSYDLIYWLFLSFRVIFRNAMADFKTAKLTRKTLRLYAFICSVLFFICGKGGGIFHSLKFLLFRFLNILLKCCFVLAIGVEKCFVVLFDLVNSLNQKSIKQDSCHYIYSTLIHFTQLLTKSGFPTAMLYTNDV